MELTQARQVVIIQYVFATICAVSWNSIQNNTSLAWNIRHNVFTGWKGVHSCAGYHFFIHFVLEC